MQGEKLKLVKTTLRFMLTQLNENDRVSLVTFSDDGQRLCKLLRMNENGKKRVGALINYLHVQSTTEMIKGLEFGLFVLAGRRYFNKASALLILSDGQDNDSSTSLERANEAIQKIKVEGEYTIHSFGYGSDNDAKLMSSMSEAKNGLYYYIEELDSIAEAFANCLGEIISTAADNIQVTLETQACEVPFALKKVYSDNGDTSFAMPSLLHGSQKEAIFILNIGPVELANDEEIITPLKATVAYRQVQNNENKIIEQLLQITLRKNNTEAIIYDQDAVINFYRFKTSEALKEAGELGKSGEMEKARNLLQECANEIKQSPVGAINLAKVLISDLEGSMGKFVTYESYNHGGGEADILSKVYTHKSKRGQNVCEYQNLCQQDMIMESKNYFRKNLSD